MSSRRSPKDSYLPAWGKCGIVVSLGLIFAGKFINLFDTPKSGEKLTEEPRTAVKLAGLPGVNKTADAADLAEFAKRLHVITSQANEASGDEVVALYHALDTLEEHLVSWRINKKWINFAEELGNSITVVRHTMLKNFPDALKTEYEEALENIDSPAEVSTYDNPDYWDRHYNISELPQEWYLDGLFTELEPYSLSEEFGDKKFTDLGSLITEVKPKNVLVLGAGNSQISADLVDKLNLPPNSVVSVDISEVIIEKMRVARPDLMWVKADATQLTQELSKEENKELPQKFDLIIEKGTYDALESDQVKEEAILKETMKVLSGRLVSISVRAEAKQGFKCESLTLQKAKADKSTGIYLHFCKL